jgi:hypothetical protein
MKCSSDYSLVIFEKILKSQSIDQVLRSAGSGRNRTRAWTNKTRRGREIDGRITGCRQHPELHSSDNGYRVGHGMIGTVLIAFDGDPLTILVLIAR